MVIVRDPTQEIIDGMRLYVETYGTHSFNYMDRQLFMETHQFEPTPTGFMAYFRALLEEYDVHIRTDDTDMVRES
jgi:hypothetical protein